MYSQFWFTHSLWFIFGVGMLITSMTGNFNLRSCARAKYNPIYLDPFLFCVILYFDYNRTFESHVIAGMYIALVVERIIMYFLFMRSMIDQLTTHLGIPFVRTKQSVMRKVK